MLYLTGKRDIITTDNYRTFPINKNYLTRSIKICLFDDIKSDGGHAVSINVGKIDETVSYTHLTLPTSDLV